MAENWKDKNWKGKDRKIGRMEDER